MITQHEVEARSLPGERWAPVDGFPQTWISTHGRVARRARGPDPVVIISKGILTKLNYPRIVLTLNKKRHHKLVHRLVVDAFIGPVPKGKCVNHKDGDPSNSRSDRRRESRLVDIAIPAPLGPDVIGDVDHVNALASPSTNSRAIHGRG